jgi:hypothetical protein
MEISFRLKGQTDPARPEGVRMLHNEQAKKPDVGRRSWPKGARTLQKKAQNNAASRKGSGVLRGVTRNKHEMRVTRKEEIALSLAGLAATYSPRA